MDLSKLSYEELKDLLIVKREVLFKLEAEISPILDEINRLDDLRRLEHLESRRDERERQQWLSEMTARQAHYHSR